MKWPDLKFPPINLLNAPRLSPSCQIEHEYSPEDSSEKGDLENQKANSDFKTDEHKTGTT
jgi:hypothetical protein